ncbi:copper transporter [Microlunatus panaciterrae]|uniref:Copper transport outer membrane protein, MctB n=1 Tax=Microlunatus panaciterrae TaxID=400768 RepID=A0ABS2RN85_9ACTN|nr:copper transporter [Microlunatus panaciterrae]MBM7800466.1 hypothetical protein [Microlunatus panaciterrae]
MINFRYHIVSLVAVFMALAIGIVVGATILGDRINEGIVAQAAQDRKELQLQRAEVLRLNDLLKYQNDYAEKVAKPISDQLLRDQTVAIVTMPGAPRSVVNSVSAAVTDAGGVVTATAEVRSNTFDPDRAADTDAVVKAFADRVTFQPNDTTATKVGRLIARALLAHEPLTRDPVADDIIKGLADGKLVSTNTDGNLRARVVVVVTAPALDPRPEAEVLAAHVQLEVALKGETAGAVAAVVAGPNSEDVEGTDVASVRADAIATEALSTVDVADLPSGVTTVVLAAKEQLLGRQGHYGAAPSRDDVAPKIPVQ